MMCGLLKMAATLYVSAPMPASMSNNPNWVLPRYARKVVMLTM